jgi:FtsZ-binding cell division protein ZapB
MEDNSMAVDENSEAEAYDSDNPAFIAPEVQMNNGVDSADEEEDYPGAPDDVAVLQLENRRLTQETKDLRRLLEQMHNQMNILKREHAQCKRKIKQAINRVSNGTAVNNTPVAQGEEETFERITRWKGTIICLCQ